MSENKVDYVKGKQYLYDIDGKFVTMYCFDKSNEYAYLAPLTLDKEGNLNVNLTKIKVCSTKEGNLNADLTKIKVCNTKEGTSYPVTEIRIPDFKKKQEIDKRYEEAVANDRNKKRPFVTFHYTNGEEKSIDLIGANETFDSIVQKLSTCISFYIYIEDSRIFINRRNICYAEFDYRTLKTTE